MISRIIFFSVAASIVFSVHAGPFGFKQGMTVKEIKQLGTFSQEVDGGAIKLDATTLTNGNPDFMGYHLTLTEKNGLCKIMAFVKTVKTDRSGGQLKNKYDALVKTISEKYGQSTDVSIQSRIKFFQEDRNFMNAILKQERKEMKQWESSPKKSLPDSLDIITLEMLAFSEVEGGFILTYDFKNIEDCVTNINKVNSSNL